MAVVMITADMMYRMRKLKQEMEEKKKRSRWGYAVAIAFVVAWLLVGR